MCHMNSLQVIGATEAAKLLKVSRAHIPRLVEAGDLSPVGKLGARGILVFDATEVDRVAQERAGKTVES